MFTNHINKPLSKWEMKEQFTKHKPKMKIYVILNKLQHR